MQQPQLKDSHSDRGLIIVYGPPASGKSTISHQIQRSFRKQQTPSNQSSIVISADCLEQYLRGNDVHQLRKILRLQSGVGEVMSLKLRRSQFIEQNWKLSRDLIKEITPQLIKTYSLVIIEDDLLLKSQRKYFKHIAETFRLLYCQILIECSLEQCLLNSKSRTVAEGHQFQLSEDKIRQCYNKMQYEINPFTIVHHFLKPVQWRMVGERLKMVEIEHPQLAVKPLASEHSSAQNSAQVQIRKFISQVMANNQLQWKHFKTGDLKEISSRIQAIKKSYKSKSKSLQQFLMHFENETYFKD